MNQMMQIQNQEIQVKEFNGQRVVTFKDIDLVHERPSGTAHRNFKTNRKHLLEGQDYCHISLDEIRLMGIASTGNYPNGLILITESGYLMLVKSFTDDLAWAVQRQLVNCYFKVKEAREQATITVTEQKTLSDKERIKIGEVIASCSQHNLKVLIDIYRPYLSAEIINEYLSQSSVTKVETSGNLAEQLNQYLNGNGLTKTEFAKKSQLPKSAVSMYCSGKTKAPNAKNIKKITMAMSCEL